MQLRYLRNLHLILNGEAFWLLDDFRSDMAGAAPQRIFPLLPERIEVKIANGMPSEYVYHEGTKRISYPPEAIIHFKKMNPTNIYRGHSPMKSARWAVASYREGEEMNYERMKNNGFPDTVLTSQQKIPDKERDSLLEKFMAKFSSQKKKARVGFMPYGVEAKSMSATNKDMQYTELMQKTMEAILANWRVPLDVLGMTKDNTRANADAALFQFMRYCVLPVIEIELDTLTSDYCPMFPNSLGQFYTCKDFIPENMEDKRENNKALFGMGGLKPNEARQEFGRDTVEDENADKLFISSTYSPLENSGKIPAALDPDADTEDEEGRDEPMPKKKAKSEKPKDDDEEEQRLQVKTKLTPDGDLLDPDMEIEKFQVIIEPYATRGFVRGVEMAKKPKSAIKPSDMLTPEMRQALKDKSFKIAAYVVGTSQTQLRDLIVEAIAKGFGSDKVAAMIRRKYGDTSPVRARATARTLLTSSINNGQFRTLRLEGWTEKQWLTIMDGRQRDSHGKQNGQIVPIEEPFILENGAGMFPGDDNLPSDESINCRCDIVGAGTSDLFQSQHYKQFLKVHGALEEMLTVALTAEFKKQAGRAIKALPS
jgi:uncharacterized protein with gpF-like domain